MKLSLPKEELQRGLARIQAIVEKRNSMPILANALLRAGKNPQALEIAATDLEVAIRGSVDAKVTKPGAVTVSARKLFEIVRELPDEPVELTASADSHLELKCARTRFQLAGAAAEEYPDLAEPKPGRMARLQASVLAEMIERTLYAASTDETRYNLNGVYFQVLEESGRIRMVATDGHRLAMVDRTIGADAEALESGVILPRKALLELKRLVDDDTTEDLELGFEKSQALACRAGVTVAMRLIEGEFPNYANVIPKDIGQRLVLPVEPLAHAVRRVSLLSSDRSRMVRIEIEPGVLRAMATDSELGQAQEEIDVDFDGEPMKIGFNARYLLDALGAFGAKEMELGLKDELSPALLRPTDDGDTLAVVMPMRLGAE